MKNPTHQKLLEVCIEAAKATGTYALENIHRREEVLENFDHDVKLVMDRECQTLAEEIIHSRFPDHAILGEEGAIEKEHAFEWIVDPIDGTANYTRGFPYWCCSIAVRRKKLVGQASLYSESLCPPHAPEYGTRPTGERPRYCEATPEGSGNRVLQTMRSDEVLAGCVFVPALNECYSASIDTPALCNGEPIHDSNVPTLGKATFFAGLTKDIDPRAIDFFGDMAPRVSKIRMLGSAAIDICHVACGRSDGYFEAGLYLWDIAAAGLIAERAGAVISEWPRDEEHGVRYLCTTPAIHTEIKTTVEKHFEG